MRDSAPRRQSPTRVLAQRRPVVVLGTAPAETGRPAWDILSPSGARLAALAGIDADPGARPEAPELSEVFALDNLVPYADPSREALADAGRLYAFLPGFWYLLAGTEVTRALGSRSMPAPSPMALPWHDAWGRGLLSWYESREGVTMAVLPHPSGRNRWYNDLRCKKAAEEFLRAARWPHRQGAAQLLFERARAMRAAR